MKFPKRFVAQERGEDQQAQGISKTLMNRSIAVSSTGSKVTRYIDIHQQYSNITPEEL